MTTEYSGGGDPARSLALLWRTQERPGRAGKSGLSVDRIVRTAIDLADADGLAALSMRRVAERLGVGTMSLYTYVPGKAELLDVMVDTAYGETVRHDGRPGGWRARLEQVARKNWALYRRHPWMLQIATTRPPLGPNLVAKYDDELRAVEGIGLTEIEMDQLITLVGTYVQGAARTAVEAVQVEERSGMTDEQWYWAHAPHLDKVLDASRYPVAARVGATVGAVYEAVSDPTRAFEFGLQRVLDGIGAFIETCTARR